MHSDKELKLGTACLLHSVFTPSHVGVPHSLCAASLQFINIISTQFFFWAPSIYTFAILSMPKLCACCHQHVILGVLAAQPQRNLCVLNAYCIVLRMAVAFKGACQRVTSSPLIRGKMTGARRSLRQLGGRDGREETEMARESCGVWRWDK